MLKVRRADIDSLKFTLSRAVWLAGYKDSDLEALLVKLSVKDLMVLSATIKAKINLVQANNI